MTADASVVALEPGAVFLLTSRGVVEGKYKAEEFGLQRVKDVLQQSRAASAKDLCLSVLDRVHQFMCTPRRHDDVTALALARNS
jgi:serine phosphatase RsbU (regulator of sigma subunit)